MSTQSYSRSFKVKTEKSRRFNNKYVKEMTVCFSKVTVTSYRLLCNDISEFPPQLSVLLFCIFEQLTWLVVTEVRSENFGLVTERSHYNGQARYRAPSLKQTSHVANLRCVFIVECGIARFPCAMPVFEVRASPSYPMLPLCQIPFFRGLQWWASSWRKIAYSITHSITQSPSLFDAPGTEAFASE